MRKIIESFLRKLTDSQIFFILIGLLAISAASLGHESFAQSSEPISVEAELDSEFILQVNQSAQIESEDITITFLSVTADSRCPADVMCVWMGQAEIEVLAQKGDEESIMSLSIGGESTPEESIFDMYLIQLIELAPYPYSTVVINPDEYAATLKITKYEELREEQILLPPLKQVKLGQEPSCKENLVLIKKYNGDPACVKQETREKLIERGWTLEN
jgi:hypothetical protein